MNTWQKNRQEKLILKTIINPEDLKIEPFKSSGKGGQHRNKTETAIRVTHIPTGITIVAQNERSQHQNKEQALKVIKAKIIDIEIKKQEIEICKERKKQVGSAERNLKIRTYDFKNHKVIDSRIPKETFNLEKILNGELNELMEKLIYSNKKDRLITVNK